jgi:pimeloyl-ACP methyl ester carboxylesterase
MPEFPDSYALISSARSTHTAVVFVHGFFGDAYSTWQDFQVLVDEYSHIYTEWNDTDLFFFEYGGEQALPMASADRLDRFVKYVFPHPKESLFSEDVAGLDWQVDQPFDRVFIRHGPYKYKHLVLVGHSLGALIIRLTVLEEAKEYAEAKKSTGAKGAAVDSAYWNKRYPLLSAHVRLIAPAHLGFRPAGLRGALFKLPRLRGILRSILMCWPAFSDLAEDSLTIKSLQEQTEALAELNPEVRALRARALWGENERIVAVGQYRCDPRPTFVAMRDHVSVCKPLRTYLRPIEFVSEREATDDRARRAGTL